MKRESNMKRLALAFVFGLLMALQVTPVAAAPLSWPNGPWLVPQQESSLESIRDYPNPHIPH